MVLVGISKHRFLLPALGVAIVAAAVAVGAIVAGSDDDSKDAEPPPPSLVTVSKTSDLAILELATGRVRLVTDSSRSFVAVSSPSWSPDGRRIVVGLQECRTCPFRLAMARAGGTGPEAVRACRDEANEPAWSPTGRDLVFTTSEEGERKLVLLDLRSDRCQELEVHEEEEEGEAGEEEEGEAPNHPVFSRDGASVLFDAEASRERTRLFRFELATEELHELETEADHNASPAVSPGGNIAFSQTDTNSTWDVCVLRRAPSCVTQGPSNDVEPTWLSDDSLIFASDRDDPQQRLIRSLYTVRLDGGGLRRLTRGFDDGAPAVSPDGTEVAFVRRQIVRVD